MYLYLNVSAKKKKEEISKWVDTSWYLQNGWMCEFVVWESLSVLTYE